MSSAGSFVNRPRGGFAQMPGPWAPSFNLPNAMRGTPMPLVRDHMYPWAKDVTRDGVAMVQEGYTPPPFMLPETARHPYKHPAGAAMAVGRSRTRLRAMRDAALAHLQIPARPVPPMPVPRGTPQPTGLNVPNIPPQMNGSPQVYQTAAAMTEDPVGYFDPRAERITFLRELSRALSLDAFTKATSR